MISLFCISNFIINSVIQVERMLPSPTSSLSSFRDYYQHTSEYSQQALNSQQFINKGITNFKISKVFTKFNWKINQESYWAIFYAFKKIKISAKQNQKRRRAGQRLIHILQNQARKEGAIVVQCNYLHELWKNVRDERQKEISRTIAFGMKFIKQNYINTALCYHQVIKKLTIRNKGAVKQASLQKKKYLLKLSKAVLSLLVRNLIQKKIFNYFKQLKSTYNNNQQIASFKVKKEKVYHQRRQNNRMVKILPLIQIIQRKVYKNLKDIFIRLMKTKQQAKMRIEEDSNIFTHITKHMIYLTGSSIKQLERTERNDDQAIRAFKLSLLLKRRKNEKQDILRQFTLHWRRVVNEQHLLLSRQIGKLQLIKKYYMDST